MKRTSPYEKEWCAKYDLDFIVLKEVRVLIAYLKMRLNKLNLYTDKITKNFDFARDDQSCLFFNVFKSYKIDCSCRSILWKIYQVPIL